MRQENAANETHSQFAEKGEKKTVSTKKYIISHLEGNELHDGPT